MPLTENEFDTVADQIRQTTAELVKEIRDMGQLIQQIAEFVERRTPEEIQAFFNR